MPRRLARKKPGAHQRQITRVVIIGLGLWATFSWIWLLASFTSTPIQDRPLLGSELPDALRTSSVSGVLSVRNVTRVTADVTDLYPGSTLKTAPQSQLQMMQDVPKSHSKQGDAVGGMNALQDVPKSHSKVVDRRMLESNRKRQQLPPERMHAKDVDAKANVFTFPLIANSGTHHVTMYIGSPPQKQILIVDTGSRLTAFPCKPQCSNCRKHVSEQFVLGSSTTHHINTCAECKLTQAEFSLDAYLARDEKGGISGDGPSPPGLRGALKKEAHPQRNLFPNSCIQNQCAIEQHYTEGSSWTSFEVTDNVWLGSTDESISKKEHAKYSTPFSFGCQTQVTGLFEKQYADGIMGMSLYTHTLVNTWYRHEKILDESFSICLNGHGGSLTIGGTGSATNVNEAARRSHHLMPMQYTPFAKMSSWYYTVDVISVIVGDHVLPTQVLQHFNDFKGTIIDTGTTDTFINKRVAQPFKNAWEKQAGRTYSNKMTQYTYEQFKKIPSITLELKGGVKWEMKPRHYMELNSFKDANKPWQGALMFTNRVYLDEPHGVVLGSNAMMEKEVHFDITKRKLGVANAVCAY